ncbi:hypothetical protein G6011_00286 [Alternaria panax]|uniref:Uncharacterized protein n=1 Tax=Alternaria panax TaxID=48097 RepID=A0AAD4IIT2_9PLEO|nr:hypothetical protein G6011_00286 [Alternaria panax]
MGYGEVPGLLNYKPHPEHPAATLIQPIVPAITLTEPTPSSSQASAASQDTTPQAMDRSASKEDACSPAAVDRHLQDAHQFSPPPSTNSLQHSKSSPTQSSDPPLRFVPRSAADYQAILQAMETGRFDIPIFGEAGVAFQNRSKPGTPLPRNKKRKRAQTPDNKDIQGGERAPKKPARRKKKAAKLESLA